MTTPLPNEVRTNVRTVGSNYTTFRYAGKSIAYLENVVDSGQKALSTGGAGYEFIHPLGYRTPTDIVTSRVLDGGTLTLGIRELWHQEIWQQLKDLTGAHTIVDIFAQLAASPTYVTCAKIVTPPNGKSYGKNYHRCTVVQINDGDEVQIGTLSVQKQIQVAYTNVTAL